MCRRTLCFMFARKEGLREVVGEWNATRCVEEH